MAISDRLTKLTTDITNAYTSIENKGGTIPSDKNTNNLATAINSIEVIEEATAEGEDLTLTNTKAMPIKSVKVKGKTEQFTTTGKQLLLLTDGTYENNGVTVIVKDGKITLNGTATAYSVCAIPAQIINFDSTKSYVFSSQNIFGTGTQVSDSQTNYVLFATANNDTIAELRPLRTSPIRSVVKTSLTSALNKVRITSSNGVSYNNYGYYLQVEQNNEMTDWEPYTAGASPNPTYPQEIQNVEGKNIFDKSTVSIGYINYNTGEFTSNDTFTSSDFIGVKSNTNYCCNWVEYDSSSYGLAYYDNSKNYISGRKLYGLKNKFITPNNAKYLRFCVRNSNYPGGYSITDINTLMLVEGTTLPDTYIPYNSIEFKVQNKNLLPFNNQDFTLNGVRYYVQNGTLYLNGTSSGETSTTNQMFKDNFSFILPAGTYYIKKSTGNVSFALKYKSNNETVRNTQGSFTLTEKTELYIGFYIYNKVFTNELIDMMINIRDTIQEYIPHAEQTQIFTFEEGQYLAEGGYLADDGIHNVMGQYTFTGQESFGNYSSNYKGFNYKISDANINSTNPSENIKCNHLKVATERGYAATASMTIGIKTYAATTGDDTKYIFMCTEDTEKTNFVSRLTQAYQSGNPYIIQYKLANPQPTPYTEAQQAQYYQMQRTFTYEDITHTSTDGDLRPSTELEYYKKK